MVSSLVTCIIHIFAVCVAVCTVIERGVHHQNHEAVDSELFIEALVVHLAPRVVCSRKQSVIAWVQKKVPVRRKSTFEFQHLAGVPNYCGRSRS